MTEFFRIWVPRIGQGRDAPIKAGIYRALVQLCPLAMSETLSPRLKAAIEALLEREPVTSEDQRQGSAR